MDTPAAIDIIHIMDIVTITTAIRMDIIHTVTFRMAPMDIMVIHLASMVGTMVTGITRMVMVMAMATVILMGGILAGVTGVGATPVGVIMVVAITDEMRRSVFGLGWND